MKIKIEIEIDTIEDRQELDDIISFIKSQLHDSTPVEVQSSNKKQTFKERK